MSERDAIVDLGDVDPARVAEAVHAVATADRARADRLRSGAAQSVAAEPSDPATARAFQTVLELGYLVASADGFADEERASLARLLESITGAAVDHAALELHFADLDQAVDLLGRHQRLARSAAELEDEASALEGLTLAALIAMADGRLSATELQALQELGGHLSISAERVREVVDDVARRVEAQLS